LRLDDSAGRIELDTIVCGEDLTRLLLPGARVHNKHGSPTFNFLFDVDEAGIQEFVKSRRRVLSATKSRQEGGAGAEVARELRRRSLVLHSMSITRRARLNGAMPGETCCPGDIPVRKRFRSRVDEVQVANVAWRWRDDDSAKVSLSVGYAPAILTPATPPELSAQSRTARQSYRAQPRD
jgi:hypothetical protein